MTTASFDLADLNSNNGFTINGINAGDRAGYSVSGAGDINGDGIDDLIIGARGASQSYVVFGSDEGFPASLELDDLDGSNGFALNGIQGTYGGDTSGYSVSGAGDINGDGIDDLIIGTKYAAQSYVVFGSDEGFPASLELADLDGNNGFVLSNISQTEFGSISVVSGAGDINGDGVDDLIVGARGEDSNSISYAGQSYVVFGSTSGFPANLALVDLDGSNGFALNGINEFDNSGTSVSGAGDINGDGIDDLIIGATNADPNGSSSGQSYVVFGSDEGFPASLELADLDGSNGFALNGINQLDNSGTSVSGIGDINGDGIDDLIVGASGANPNGKTNAGQSYVVFGSDEGFPASLELDDLDGSNGFALNGINAFDLSGRSVSGAGDVNGDGIDDLIIGAPGSSSPISFPGQSYVIFGSDEVFPASLELADLDGNNGFALNGIIVFDLSGRSVSGAGDVNGDGTDDLIIGAPLAIDRIGQSYVVFGGAFEFPPAEINGTPDNDLLTGTPDSDRINGFGGNDLLIGNQGNDLLIGGGDRDRFAITEGDGIDTITDFGGVGRGGNPPQEVIDEVDTIQFFGEGLTAENMLLTQKDSDLEITFEGVENTQVILQDFALEDLENLDNGIGNILFDGQQEIENSFDVFNSDLIRSTVFRRDTVTFLNDLDNTTQGFEDSNDVINGQGGSDILVGRSGDDLLRGGEGDDVLLDGGAGNDRLDGGVGNDGLFGGADADQFVLRAGDGADTIFDFEDEIDSFLLADGLEFEQLGIDSSNGDTLISIVETRELLVSLIGVDASDISSEDFAPLV